jgi:hypothetical protein
VTTTTGPAVGYSVIQGGNYLTGLLTLTRNGTDRYAALGHYSDTSNPGQNVPGAIDFSAIGLPLMPGHGPMVPTGGGAFGLNPEQLGSIASWLTHPAQSAASGNVRGTEAVGTGTLFDGLHWSGASGLRLSSEQGNANAHQYCFPAGTRVVLADGSTRPIEQVRPGDVVLSVPDDDPLAAPAGHVVGRVFQNGVQQLLNIHISGAVVRSTAGHPFYIRGRGWTSAASLRPGDELRTSAGGWVAVTEVYDDGAAEPVFNLEVAGPRTYFVVLPGSDTAVLVHNISPLVILGVLAVGALVGALAGGLSGKHGWDWSRAGAGAIVGFEVAAGALLVVATGGEALPLALPLFGAAIGGGIGGGLFTGRGHINWGNFWGGQAVGAEIGLVTGVALFVGGPLAAFGAAVGGIHGVMDVYAASNGHAGLGAYLLGGGLGSIFGAIAPIPTFVGMAGALAGGAWEATHGGKFFGTYFQIGGLVGGLVGGLGEAFTRAALKAVATEAAGMAAVRAGLAAGGRAILPELGGMAVGAGVGYAITGTWQGALLGANWGMMAVGVTRAGMALYQARAQINQGFRTALSTFVHSEDFLPAAERSLMNRGAAGLAKMLKVPVCFASGTPLLTPDGSKPIEEFRPGDAVLSRSEFDPEGPVAVKVVEEVFVRSGFVFKLSVQGRVIRTTAEHPFYVPARGWITAGLLRAGDVLLSHDGELVTVDGVEETPEYTTVYNLRVADYHTYFVGSPAWGFSVWAHNEYEVTSVDAVGFEAARNDLRQMLKSEGLELNNEQLNELMVRSPTGKLNSAKTTGQLRNVLENITGQDATEVHAEQVAQWLQKDYSYKVTYVNDADPSNVSGLKITIRQGKSVEWDYIQGGVNGLKGARGPEYVKARVLAGTQKGHIMAVEDGLRLNFVDDSAINIISETPTVNLSDVKRFEIWRQDPANGILGARNLVKVVEVDVGGGQMKDYIQWTITKGGQTLVDVKFNPLSQNRWVDGWWLSTGATFHGLQLAAPDAAGFTPAAIRTAYGVNKLAWDGRGQVVAVVGAYDNPGIFASLDAFDSRFGRTASGPTFSQEYGPASSFLTVLGQDGGRALPGTDPTGAGAVNWEAEEALDVEWVHALAPGARVVLVEARSPSLADLMTAVATAAGLPGVSVVSMSWGVVEGRDVVAQDEARYDSYLTTPAGHQGVTFVASTGDLGAGVPQYPAFSPNVISVGGTSLAVGGSNSYSGEVAWGYYDASSGTFVGSGGGVSRFEPEPLYQSGVQSTGHRTTPDVSFVADPATGAWVADAYNLAGDNPWEVAGGTSLAAPSWAGLLALANQGRAAAGRATLGSAGPTEAQQALYGLGRADFHDVTAGNNGYSAGVGYDLATGLGTPVADRLLADLAAYSGDARATPAAPVAVRGPVSSANAGTGSVTLGAPVAPGVLSARSFGTQASGLTTGSAEALPPRALRPATAVGTVSATDGRGAGHGASVDAGARRAALAPVSPDVAGTDLAGGRTSQAVGLGVGPAPEASSASAWWPALVEIPLALHSVPAAPGGGLRPDMPADGDSDVLVGGAGADVLVGGAGRDLLVGGYATGDLVEQPQPDGSIAADGRSPSHAARDWLFTHDRESVSVFDLGSGDPRSDG